MNRRDMLRRKKEADDTTGRAPRNPGQKSAPVFSYYSSRAAQEGGRRLPQTQAPARSRPKSRWLPYLPSLLSLALVAGAVMYVGTLATSPRIQIDTGGGRLVVVQEQSVYQNAAESIMKKSLFSRSKLTIETDKIAAQLQEQFPEIGDVVVTVPLISRRPVIQIQPATPALMLLADSGSFIIDKSGRTVLEANLLASSIRDKLPIVSDESGTEFTMGKKQLTTELVEFVGAIDAQLKAKAIGVQTYTLPSLANELHVRLVGQGYTVKFNTEVDARQQVGTFIAVKEKLAADGVTPLEYIDVRVEERAYFK